MYIGYARVSTQDQHLDLQQEALQQAGCQRIIVDRVSGTVTERPGLVKLKEILRADDTLVVWRLDRLGRSLKDLIAWVAWLEQEAIGLRSLHEALDTTTPSKRSPPQAAGLLGTKPIQTRIIARHHSSQDDAVGCIDGSLPR